MTDAAPDPPTRAAASPPHDGDERPEDELMLTIYSELRRLADRHMAGEPDSHTLQPTALVHEAYLRILGDTRTQWANEAHLFAAAARAMRRILIERARRRKGPTRGGGWRRVSLEAGDLTFSTDPGELLALDDALDELEARDERAFSIVMLRFFAGMSVEKIAALLEISDRTVKREWRFARAWLRDRVGDPRLDADEPGED
jgi:RNA polymerase sigma factor (TIGR02999 family)